MSMSVVAARICFAIVFAINVYCALGFIISPADFVAAYQLEGAAGIAAVQGFGVVFLMWNATYPLFIWKPTKHTALGIIILVQQLIGCIGETLILFSLPAGFEVLSGSIIRFIAFDVAGLVIMAVSYIWMRVDISKLP